MIGLVGAAMEVMDGMHAGQSWSHVGRFRSTSRVRGDTLITPDHIAVQVRALGSAKSELVGFP